MCRIKFWCKDELFILRMRKIWITAFILHIGWASIAQHQELVEKPDIWKANRQQQEDTTSILHAFRKGSIQGHLRYYFMTTNNAEGLTDYYAHAVGGGVKYETAPFKGFQFGMSGFFAFNIQSSDLSKADPKTGQMNRYEIGLFDLTDPSNKSDIDRLEELYLKYNWKKSQVVVGKQLLNTPFINLQDGRMRPTEVGALWAEVNEVKNTRFEGGYIYEVSPRSTVKWYGVAESMGIYPSGVNTDGNKSNYAGNLSSGGIALLGVTHQLQKNLSVKLWDVYVDQIFNTAMVQADYTHPLKNDRKLLAGIQYVRQDALKHGGNADAAKTYMEKNARSQTFGARIELATKKWQTSLNYNRITAEGRYLMPREWGRDPFFTFLPRERNEGLGDVNAYVWKMEVKIPKIRVKTQLGLGYYDLPDVNNFTLNKYGMPSYAQLNVDLRYAFNGLLKGLESQFLYVYKRKAGDTYNSDKFIINKVNMSVWHLVVNYYF